MEKFSYDKLWLQNCNHTCLRLVVTNCGLNQTAPQTHIPSLSKRKEKNTHIPSWHTLGAFKTLQCTSYSEFQITAQSMKAYIKLHCGTTGATSSPPYRSSISEVPKQQRQETYLHIMKSSSSCCRHEWVHKISTQGQSC